MLKELFKIEENSIISVVGSGGKTSFIKSFAKSVPNKKTLISTTTKIGFNQIEYDFLYENQLPVELKPGISFAYFDKDYEREKIIGLKKETFENYKLDYDYILLECDGSRRKKIKAWEDHEPVIPNNTNYTVGIINLKLLGEKISEENTHRYNLFRNIFNLENDTIFSLDIFQEIINKYLFEKAIGKKLLFINQIDSKEEEIICRDFLKRDLFVDKIVFGSLHNNIFWEGR